MYMTPNMMTNIRMLAFRLEEAIGQLHEQDWSRHQIAQHYAGRNPTPAVVRAVSKAIASYGNRKVSDAHYGSEEAIKAREEKAKVEAQKKFDAEKRAEVRRAEERKREKQIERENLLSPDGVAALLRNREIEAERKAKGLPPLGLQVEA